MWKFYGSVHFPQNFHTRKLGKHCVNSVRIWNFSGPYYPVFGPENSEYGHFLRSENYDILHSVYGKTIKHF